MKPIGEDCPNCGAEMVGPDPFYDGDLAYCEECEMKTGITVNEDGSFYLQDET